MAFTPLLPSERRYFPRLWNYLDNKWDVLEAITYSSMLASAAAFIRSDRRKQDGGAHGHLDEQDATVAALCGVANVFAALNLVSFLRPFRAYGGRIQVVIQIIIDIRPFLTVMLICILGFAMAFAIILPDQRNFQLPVVLLTTYQMMLGTWDIEEFDGYTTGSVDRLTALAAGLFVIYTIFMVVIAMNLLITIMSDSYDRVRMNELAYGRIEQAAALVSMEWIARPFWSTEACFPPKFLHVLTTREEAITDDDWGGRLKQLQREIPKQTAEHVEENMKTEIDEIKKKVDNLKAEMVTKADLRALLRELVAERKGASAADGPQATSGELGIGFGSDA